MSAFRIVPPEEAFTLSRHKRPRQEKRDHLEWIRTLPCVVSGRKPVDAAHIRFTDPRYGKRETGKGEKPDDKFVVPLHHALHMDQHCEGEKGWWAKQGIDPLRIAVALYACSGDDAAAEVILRNARTP